MMIKDSNTINKFAEILLEAFFDGAVNVEEGLPPGFSQADIEDPVDYSKHEGKPMLRAFESLLDPSEPGLGKHELEPMLKKKAEFGGKADHETPYIHRSTFVVVDEKGDQLDLDKLRDTIVKRPKRILAQNGKIQKSGKGNYVFFNVTLPAYKGIWFDENKHEFKIVTTCPSAGSCKQICYARKGGYVQFPAAFTFSAQVLNFLLNDWQGFKAQLSKEIEEEYNKYSKQGITVVIRWHDSGDFFNEKYLQIALDIARSTPNVIHYAYTKQVGMVDKASKPKNFVFNYSLGGTQDNTISNDHKKSIIVPKNVFRDVFPTDERGIHTKWVDITPEMLKTLRERLSKAYGTDPKSIITYKQLIAIPYKPDTATPKWNVIVKPGDGDDSAMRKDVITTFLLIH